VHAANPSAEAQLKEAAMPQYMLLIYTGEEGAPSPEEMPGLMQRWDEYTQSIKDGGVFVAGDALQGTDVATTVREVGGEVQITDGPFAETREHLGGYYLLDCASLDVALEYASRAPNLSYGSVEVRPIWDVTAVGDAAAEVQAQA
jgi:hypothetical protein